MRYALAFLALILGTPVSAMNTDNFKPIGIGRGDAPITVVEYTSLTCHHCADFHLFVLPIIKQKYINSGKIFWVIMPFPMDKEAITAFQLVASLPNDQQEDAMAKMFGAQKKWLGKGTMVAGQVLGLTPAQAQSAAQNKEVENGILAGCYHGQKELEVNATPTFFIQGQKFEGAFSLLEFEKSLELVEKGEQLANMHSVNDTVVSTQP